MKYDYYLTNPVQTSTQEVPAGTKVATIETHGHVPVDSVINAIITGRATINPPGPAADAAVIVEAVPVKKSPKSATSPGAASVAEGK